SVRAAASVPLLPSVEEVAIALGQSKIDGASRVLAYLRAREACNSQRFETGLEIMETLLSSGVLDEVEEAIVSIHWVDAMNAVGRAEMADRRLRKSMAKRLCSRRELWQRWASLNLLDLGHKLNDLLVTWPQCDAEGYGADLRWLFQSLSETGAARINCSGADLIDASGKKWGRDRFFT